MIGAIPTVSLAADSHEDWRGIYAGASLGLSKNDADLGVTTQYTQNYFVNQDHGQIKSAGTHAFKPTDLNGSVFAGNNWQSGNWVYGLEASVTFENFDEERNTPYTTYISAPAQSFRMDTSVVSYWNAKLQPRLGYAQKRSLFYVEAGPALTQIQYDLTFQDKAVNNEYTHISTNDFALGWSAGFGLEHKLKDNWSIKSGLSFTSFDNAVRANSNLKNYADGLKHDLDYSIINFQVGLVKRF